MAERPRYTETIVQPSGEVGCYVLHLYCQGTECPCKEISGEHWNLGTNEFTGHSLRGARREARESGWKRRNGRWYCPHADPRRTGDEDG